MISAKKTIAMGFAVASLLLLAAAAVSAADGPAVMITDYKVEPEVLMPGDTGTITVTIQNMDTQSSETKTTTTTTTSYTSSTTTTSTVNAEIESIRLSSRSRDIEWLREGSQRSEYFNVGALGPGESITIAIPIKAATHTSEGTYFPEVCIEVDNGDNVRFPIPVKVESSSVEILEKDVPSEISLSESKEIAMVVANNRPNPVSGVKVLVKAEREELEFTPECIFIGNLAPYEKRDVNFSLTPLSVGNKDIQFEVEYKNGVNSHRNTLETAVFVRSNADVRLILVDAPKSVLRGEVVRIDFDVANGMAKDVKAVSVVPVSNGGGRVRILPSEYFIGDMEAGDVFSASFDVDTRELSAGENRIAFKLAFRDIDTDRIYETVGYEVHIEVKEPQKDALPAMSMSFVALPVILLSVVAVVWVRVKHRRKMVA
ncbi:MAG: hypothetical protein WA977_05820 [Halobacteriota archaeon]